MAHLYHLMRMFVFITRLKFPGQQTSAQSLRHAASAPLQAQNSFILLPFHYWYTLLNITEGRFCFITIEAVPHLFIIVVSKTISTALSHSRRCLALAMASETFSDDGPPGTFLESTQLLMSTALYTSSSTRE